jgi:hypothetical protein
MFLLVLLFPKQSAPACVCIAQSYEKRPALAGRRVRFCNNIQPAYRGFVVVPVVVVVVDIVIYPRLPL